MSTQEELRRLRKSNAELLKACRAALRWYHDDTVATGATGDVFGPNGVLATAIAANTKAESPE